MTLLQYINYDVVCFAKPILAADVSTTRKVAVLVNLKPDSTKHVEYYKIPG